MIFGNPVGLPQVIFVLGLLCFALWKTRWIRVLLSICLIIWGVFAMPYDIKIAAPLTFIGTMLLVMSTLNLISQSRQRREEI